MKRERIRKRKRCELEGCLKGASCGYEGMEKRFCGQHKLPEMIRLVTYKKCEGINCNKCASFNYIGEKRAIFCGTHAAPEMIIVRGKTYCEETGCYVTAAFNYQGEKKGRFCAKHSAPEMVNVIKEVCQEAGCRTWPSFNYQGEKTARFCATHRAPDMICVRRGSKVLLCEENGCTTNAFFNYEGEKKARFCAKHSAPGMMNVRGKFRKDASCRKTVSSSYKKCEEPGCRKRACCNYQGEKRGRFCHTHQAPRMVCMKQHNPLGGLCEESGCNTTASFNYEGKKKPRFCAKHSAPGMMNVNARVCEEALCTKYAFYNYQGMKSGRFCATHRAPDMVHVRYKQDKCEETGCTTIASFNYEGEKKARFCAKHSAPGMMNMKVKVCEDALCRKIAYFNDQGEKGARFCAEHSTFGMVCVVGNRFCEEAGCRMRAYFNYQDEKRGRFCIAHRAPNMVCIQQKKQSLCEGIGCTLQASFNYKGERKRRFCKNHSAPGMICISRKICEEPTCMTQVNAQGEKRFCAKHSAPGKISGKGKLCEVEGCDRMLFNCERNCFLHHTARQCSQEQCTSRLAIYGFLGKKARFCEQHKRTTMVQLLRLCAYQGCTMQALFNLEGEKFERWCPLHKSSQMVLIGKALEPFFELMEAADSSEENYTCECNEIPSVDYEEGRKGVCTGVSPPVLYKEGKKPVVWHSEYKKGRLYSQYKLSSSTVDKFYANCQINGCHNEADIKNQSWFCAQHTASSIDEFTSTKKCYQKRCAAEDCSGLAAFNYSGIKGPKFCFFHKLTGMESKICEYICSFQHPCTKRALFNYEGEPKGRFCQRHSVSGMTVIYTCKKAFCTESPVFDYKLCKWMNYCSQHNCEFIGCDGESTFGFEAQKGGRLCKRHRLKGMQNVVKNLCVAAGCDQKAMYNYIGEKGKLVCGIHRLDWMGKRSKLPPQCAVGGCLEQAFFNHPNKGLGKFCKQHSSKGMEHLYKICSYQDCTTNVRVDSGNGEGKEFCKIHQLIMSNQMVGGRMCKQDGCSRRATHNYKGTRGRIFCSDHALSGMLNVMNRRCAVGDCRTQARHNFPGEKQGIFCFEHRSKGMINVKDFTLCYTEGCRNVGRYGDKGKPQRYCLAHRRPDMRIGRMFCEQEGCGTHPSYNFEGLTKLRFCVMHKLPGMILIKNDRRDRRRKKQKQKGHFRKQEDVEGCIPENDMMTSLFEEEDENQTPKDPPKWIDGVQDSFLS